MSGAPSEAPAPAAGGTIDKVWRGQDVEPGEIEAAIRGLLNEVHAENSSYVPARVLNLVCVVDKEWSGEVANRLRTVGRYHPSRTVVCTVERGRETLDAVATIAAPANVKAGDFAVLRETVIVSCGEQHLPHLDRIVDPLVVTDLHTCVWSPHGHPEAVDALRSLCQVVLLDSLDEPESTDAIRRARELTEDLYVVDLAWLRSTPWRERIAATFDPARLRAELGTISAVQVRHNPESATAALLLVGWLASRLDWQCSRLAHRGSDLAGRAHGRRQDIDICLTPDPGLQVRGLAGLVLETASGRHFELNRGPGGLRAAYKNRRGDTRTWTVLGASRGESGILGEGIRQALLRDPTYGPALAAAEVLIV